MAKDGLLNEYRKYLADPDAIPSDAYAQSLVTRVIQRYGSIEGAQRILSEEEGGEEKKTKSIENKVLADENKFNLIKFSDLMQLNPDRVFDSRKDKERLIRKYGYPKLNAEYKEGKSDFLSELSDAQLGNLFKRTYYSVKKQIGK
jgi:hypothetical protein